MSFFCNKIKESYSNQIEQAVAANKQKQIEVLNQFMIVLLTLGADKEDINKVSLKDLPSDLVAKIISILNIKRNISDRDIVGKSPQRIVALIRHVLSHRSEVKISLREALHAQLNKNQFVERRNWQGFSFQFFRQQTPVMPSAEQINEKFACFDLKKYLREIGLSENIKLDASLNTLHLIVSHHAMYIPYQNFDLHARRLQGDHEALSLAKGSLEHKLLDKHQGGMCYESSELLWQALNELNFNVKRIETFALNDMPYDPSVPSTHNVLVVEIQEKKYLVDPSYGYNGIRFPLELTLDEVQEISFPQDEKYQVICKNNYYQINMWINDKNDWFSLYRFNKPLQFIDYEKTVHNNSTMMQFSGLIPIRDTYIKAGKMTLFGRVRYNIDLRYNPPQAFKIIIDNGDIKKHEYKDDVSKVVKDIESDLQIQLSNVLRSRIGC